MNIDELLKESPSLTLDPFAQEKAEMAVSPEEAAPAPVYEEEQYLTEEEKRQVDAFVNQIRIQDSTSIMQYGAGVQQKMADFSEGTLEKVRTKDLGEIGDLLGGVVTELKKFDEEDSKGISGFFKKKAAKAESLKLRYDKAEANIEKVTKTLEGHQIQLMKDSAVLDQLYELNKNYFHELNMYILAGKKKLKLVETEELPALRAKAAETGLPEDAQAVNDMEGMLTRFEKKIHDLELTRMVSLQMAPQIRMIQSSDITMSEKIQTTLTNTIPLWKSQMVIALGLEHSRKAAIAQRQVSDVTNELLKKNAEKLQMATVETAKESERGIVDMDTLVTTNEALINTIDEVMQIQREGRQKRKEAEGRLSELEQDLKQKLLAVRS
ncbi:MAG: toxic anion resistance protein [Eubacterium sp.]|nr:toxic anion resistance protein [Eubacterium sp.]